jgi:hypothetical protein
MKLSAIAKHYNTLEKILTLQDSAILADKTVMKTRYFKALLFALSSALGFWILVGAPSAQADTEADLFNRTFLTCPNGAQALQDIQAVGNELTQTQVESDLNPNSTSGAVVEQGIATILRNPGALNPAIGAPIRMTGCFAF